VSAVDPESTKPYKVQVILRVASHPLLTKTPIFKDQLRRELQEGLSAALGAMGDVEVIDLASVPEDKRSPLWKEVESKGLQAGLDGPSKSFSDTKTHFVFVDYVDGQYEIQARQHDGLTGLASPVVRRERTPDRQFVARTAALMVDRDFGLVGTIAEIGDGQTVKVGFKGGGMKVALDRWVKKGDLFALVQVVEGGAVPVRWTYLQVNDTPGEDGACSCKVLAPRKRALPAGNYRCLKLGTVRAPVRLQLLKVTQGKPALAAPSGVEVQVRHNGFTGEDGARASGISDGEGFFTTERQKDPLFDGVAYVSLLYQGSLRAEVPVALVDERPVVLPVNLSTEWSPVIAQRELWEHGLLDRQDALAGLVKQLNEAIGTPARRAQALATAQQTLGDLDRDLAVYTSERAELAKAKLPSGSKPLDLTKGDAMLKDLREGRESLRAWAARLDDILKKESDPKRQEALTLNEQAITLERQGDYGKAIELYEKVLTLTDNEKLKERLPKLKDAWETKGDGHRQARTFIYETWPTLGSPAQMKKRVADAQNAFDVCRRAKDPLGPRKLYQVALSHSRVLSKQLDALAPTTEEDRREATDLADALDGLAKLIKEVGAYLNTVAAP
jgi:tetratricopeptide (TPR) repeat protein